MNLKARLIVVVLIILLIIPLIYFLFGRNLYKYFVSVTPYTPSKIPLNKNYLFHDLSPFPIPFSITWEKPDKLIISGYVEEESLLSNGTITVRVPTEKYPRGIKVVALHDSKKYNNKISTLKLANGKYEGQQVWAFVPIEEIREYLKQGRQIIIEVSIDENSGKKLIKKAQDSGIMVVESIKSIIVSVYK